MKEQPKDIEPAPDHGVERRVFLKALAGVATAASAAPALGAPADHSHPQPAGESAEAKAPATSAPAGYVFFTLPESRFVEAVVDTMIPADAVGPGALESGVATYIDRQMAGGFGAGARLYMQGPFAEGTPQQGWQLPMTPAEVMQAGIADADVFARTRHGSAFADLTLEQRTAILKEIESGKSPRGVVPPPMFFNLLLELVYEGYFGDPIYGGNRDKAVWKMIGFPGVAGMYTADIVTYRNKPYPFTPRSIQDLS